MMPHSKSLPHGGSGSSTSTSSRSSGTGTGAVGAVVGGGSPGSPQDQQQQPQQQHEAAAQRPEQPRSNAPQQQQQQQQQQPQQPPRYASVDDFSSRVEIYRGRHSIVWNVVCRATRRPLILKGYVKVRGAARCVLRVAHCVPLRKRPGRAGTGSPPLRATLNFPSSSPLYTNNPNPTPNRPR
jgi:hypothetical protein